MARRANVASERKAERKRLLRTGHTKMTSARTAPAPAANLPPPLLGRTELDCELLEDIVVSVKVEVATREGSEGSVKVVGDNEQPNPESDVVQESVTVPANRCVYGDPVKTSAVPELPDWIAIAALDTLNE